MSSLCLLFLDNMSLVKALDQSNEVLMMLLLFNYFLVAVGVKHVFEVLQRKSSRQPTRSVRHGSGLPL